MSLPRRPVVAACPLRSVGRSAEPKSFTWRVKGRNCRETNPSDHDPPPPPPPHSYVPDPATTVIRPTTPPHQTNLDPTPYHKHQAASPRMDVSILEQGRAAAGKLRVVHGVP